MVKTLSFAALTVLALGSGSAQAAPVVSFNGGTLGVQCATTDANSQPAFNAMMKSAACAGSDGTELYKSNVGGNEVGDFAAFYETTYFNTANDPKDATISWVLNSPQFISSCADGCWLGVKDGNANPAAYGFAITGWDGKSSIFLTNFWPNQGAISNVSIWKGTGGGGGDDDFDVSAPGTLALAGLALLGGALVRRRGAAA